MSDVSNIRKRDSVQSDVTEIKLKKVKLDDNHKIVKYLIKSEPYEYGIDDLIKGPHGIGRYDGVRNYQARNHIKTMKSGDWVYFYHSNVNKNNGIYGIIEIIGDIYPDPTALDPTHKAYDSSCKSTANVTEAKWVAFDMKLIIKWEKPILLSQLKKLLEEQGDKCPIYNMMLFKNSRLSVQLVREEEAKYIESLLL